MNKLYAQSEKEIEEAPRKNTELIEKPLTGQE
jgi:hypothetical protein